jgi:hypothetical protein
MGKSTNGNGKRPTEPYGTVRRANLGRCVESGSIAGSEARKSVVYGAGRTCSEPGCKTGLSIYNPTDKCSKHPDNVVRSRARGGSPF